MLAAGYDRQAARWTRRCGGWTSDDADRGWAMLALAAPDDVADVGVGRITRFIGRDKSPGKMRSALLVAGLAGLGRIERRHAPNSSTAATASASATRRSWTRMIDGAAARGQAGTVLVLTGTGFQTPSFEQVPVVAPLSCGRRAQAHRTGLHRADDRRRGALPDVTDGRPRRWSIASST